MLCSIISPLYNSAPYLEACLDSLFSQTVQDFELLLVDDHSPDDSVDVARQYVSRHGVGERVRFLQTPQNAGPGVARNLGIEAAQGDYIAFIDSDDLWESTFLERLLAAVCPTGSQQGYDLAYCQLKYNDGREHRNPVVPSGDFTVSLKRQFLRRFVTFSVCFLFRRQFLMDNRLLFPALRNSEDTHFLTSCLLLARTIACVDEPLYIYCVHSESLSTGRNCSKYRQRLAALGGLMDDFRAMKRDSRYADLHLSSYNLVMLLLWFKKGLTQSIKDYVKNNLL